MKGQRHRFSREQSAWITTQQLSGSSAAPHSKAQWQSLHAAFLAQFPTPAGAQEVSREQYKAHVKYVQRRQETAPSTQLERVQQHLRNHEERSRARERSRGGGGSSAPVRETGGDHEEEEEDEEEEEEEEEENEDIEEIEFVEDVEMRIKTEDVLPVRAAEPPRSTPLPLLRTKATAGRLGVSAKRQRVEDKGAVHTGTGGPRSSSPAGPAAATPRPANDETVATHTQTLEVLLRETRRESQEWKLKYEAANAQLVVESSRRKGLESRLDEALATLRDTEKKLQREEKAGSVVASGAGSSQGPMAFTIHVNVDVSQNGERLQTSSQTLRVDAGAGK